MLRVRQIKVKVLDDNLDNLKRSIIKKIKVNDIEIVKIVKKSLDARDKNNVYFVYEVDINTSFESKLLNKNISDIIKTPNEEYKVICDGKNDYTRPVIVGSGPSGLFCAYLLAEKGFKPLIIERGECIEDRVNTVEKFFEDNKLNEESNIQFGEGGAGTFSDGKLNTLVKDKENRCKKIFDIFVECGAPEEIKYLNKPHIGTDILRKVIINLRNKIRSLGGEFLYNTKLTNINLNNNKLESIELNNKETMKCNLLVLAIGHSARDTFFMLKENGLRMNPKPFAVGVRIEHKQEIINKSQYGEFYKYLDPASYKLTYTTKDRRGVYSFCMCPGGYVVNASSEAGYLVVNGMSNYKRDGVNANSALVVTVNPSDFGDSIESAIEFQRNLERNAYMIGNSFIPVQRLVDYKNNIISNSIGSIDVITKGKYSFANLNDIFPEYINNSLKEAIPEFGKKIKGFDDDDAILLGVEARTSSPIRIERDEKFTSSIERIYPAGEGAGYAGGIISAAIDGLKVAEEIIHTYKSK